MNGHFAGMGCGCRTGQSLQELLLPGAGGSAVDTIGGDDLADGGVETVHGS